MKKLHLFKRTLLLLALIVGSSSVWADDYTKLFSISAGDVVSGTGYKAHTATVSGRGYVITFGGNNSSVGTNSNSRSNCKLSSYSKYAVSPVTTSSVASAFACTTSISDVSKITYTFSGGSNQTNTKVYLLYSSDNTTFSQVSLTSGTQGATISSGTSYTFAKATGYYALLFEATNSSGNWRIDGVTIDFYTTAAPSYTITAVSNNDSYGTVSGTTTITATPASGYRVKNGDTGYTVTAGTATVAHEGYSNTLTVTPASDCTVQVNFEVIPKYTVSFNAEGGSCATSSLPESTGGAGVTLPTASTDVTGWEFIGWAESKVTNTNTMPDLFAAGSTYYPTSATTLHAVYTLKETTSTFVRVTSVNQVEFAKSLVVVKNSDNYVLNHSKTASVTAPTESNSEITAPANTIFTLFGNNTDGFVLTGENGTLSQTNLATSGSDRVVDWSGNNNQWKIEANAYATNTFALSNSTNVALEYYSGWKTEYSTSYNNRQYTAMKLYVPKSAYDSNPSALTAPTVKFDSADPVTLYLDGTTENTNTATVTGVSKTINYTSSNTGVATVNSEGVVTAKGIGTAIITASVDAELGVSAPAYDTYEVTVKSATTLAGIKAVTTGSETNFTADLASDLVITYVNGSHAYLQSGNVAIYASCGNTDGWAAGKKFTGAITGQIKRYYNEYQITSIDQTPVAGGVVPDAIEVAITDLTTANYATYEGRKIAINGATVNTKMTDTDLTGGKITTDGTNTLNIYAREKGITLTKDEKGNFVGYIGRYNDGIRYYMYEQSQFTKTHNAPVNQVMSFTNSSYNIDEETDGVTDFDGQEVTKTTVKGTVTYSVKSGSDDIITSLNSSTGAVVLNGDCGTATIVATAAYAEETDGSGYITPYPELSKQYTVTVRPRYMVTFSVNGVETVLRQATSGATIAVPTPSDFGDYKFMGWSTSTVDPTNVEPSMTDLGATVKPENNDTKYFAVFAKQAIVPDVEQTSTFTFKGSAVSSPFENNEATWTFTSVSFGNQNYGLQSQSITLTPIANVTSVKEITIKKSNTWGGSVTLTMTDASSNQIFQIKNGNFTSNLYTKDITSNQSSSYTFTSSGNAWIEYITLTYLAPALAYADYRTSLPTVEVTITDAQYATFCYDRELDVTGTDVTAYTASANGEGNAVTLTKISDGIIPANTGVILFAESAGNYEINVSTTGKEAIAGNELVGVTTRTQIPETSADKYNYIFSKKNEVIGFYRASGAYLLPNRAYLSTSKRDAAAREFMAIMFDEGETTSLREIRNEELGIKNAEFYNLNGQRVATPVKGNIYIVNGKKVMFK